MGWDAIGAIGEVVGAAAVVLTLVYLAIQIRQNTRQEEFQSLQAAIELYLTNIDDATKTAEDAWLTPWIPQCLGVVQNRLTARIRIGGYA